MKRRAFLAGIVAILPGILVVKQFETAESEPVPVAVKKENIGSTATAALKAQRYIRQASWIKVGEFDRGIMPGDVIYYNEEGQLTTDCKYLKPMGVAMSYCDEKGFAKVRVDMHGQF